MPVFTSPMELLICYLVLFIVGAASALILSDAG